MPDLGVVRRYAELFVRMGLVRGEGGDYVPACAECIGVPRWVVERR